MLALAQLVTPDITAQQKELPALIVACIALLVTIATLTLSTQPPLLTPTTCKTMTMTFSSVFAQRDNIATSPPLPPKRLTAWLVPTNLCSEPLQVLTASNVLRDTIVPLTALNSQLPFVAMGTTVHPVPPLNLLALV